MTSAEALNSPRVVDQVATAADVDVRTVRRVLAGQSPFGSVWKRVEQAALACGVTGLPEPAQRKPPERKSGACAACAAADVEIARLRAALAEAQKVVPMRAAAPVPAGGQRPVGATG